MTYFLSTFRQVLRDDSGAQAVEIALGIVLIALVAGLGMVQFGESMAEFFARTGTQIDGATPGAIPTPNPDFSTPPA